MQDRVTELDRRTAFDRRGLELRLVLLHDRSRPRAATVEQPGDPLPPEPSPVPHPDPVPGTPAEPTPATVPEPTPSPSPTRPEQPTPAEPWPSPDPPDRAGRTAAERVRPDLRPGSPGPRP